MKRMHVMSGLCLLLAFASCTKENHVELMSVNQVNNEAFAEATALATGWENSSGWTAKDSGEYKVYVKEAQLGTIDPEVLAAGVINVFARNIPLENGKILDKPTRLPYSVYPQPGKPAFHEKYYYSIQSGKLYYQYRTNKHQYLPGESTEPSSALQFRAIAIPPEFLQRTGHTPYSIGLLNYTQLVTIAGIAP